MVKIKEEIISIDITPKMSSMAGLGAQNITLSEALSEFIDNSLQAKVPNKNLVIDIKISKKKISIFDNARGMNLDTFTKAFQVGDYSGESETVGKSKTRGLYGVGLKAAAITNAGKWSVLSKELGSDKLYIGSLTKDAVMKNKINPRKFNIKAQSPLPKNKSNTTIVLEDLLVEINDKVIERVRKDISESFSYDLRRDDVKIKINGILCIPSIKFKLSTAMTLPDGYKYNKEGRIVSNIKLDSGESLPGWFGILSDSKAECDYGINLLRFKRLIKKNVKIGFQPSTGFRLVGELDFDHVPVSSIKRGFEEKSFEYREIAKRNGALWKYLEPIVKLLDSKDHNATLNKRTEVKVGELLNNMRRRMNKNPFVKDYAESFFNEFGTGSKKDPNGRLKINKDSTNYLHAKPDALNKRKKRRKLSKRAKKTVLKVNGKRIILEHDVKKMGKPYPRKEFALYPEESTISVVINASYPAYKKTKDQAFFIAECCAEAIAEIMRNNSNKQMTNEEFFVMRDSILVDAF